MKIKVFTLVVTNMDTDRAVGFQDEVNCFLETVNVKDVAHKVETSSSWGNSMTTISYIIKYEE